MRKNATRLRILAVAAAAIAVAASASTFAGSAQATPPSAMSAVVAVDSTSGDPVVAVVGDVACDPDDPAFAGGTSSKCQQRATASIAAADPSIDKVLGLGDYQYDCGGAGDYAASYDPSWGQLNGLMSPVAGNHEYFTGVDASGAQCPADNSTASSYFAYFNNDGVNRAHPETGGHFSFDLGTWHVIALNGNCAKTNVGGCKASSPQTRWLRADLASTTQPCIAAFWHQPLFTGSGTGTAPAYRPWWDALYAAHADLILNGHVHNYQRFPALDPAGAADPVNGITEYIAGTGGENLQARRLSVTPTATAYRQAFGFLRLTLHPAGWTSQFINVNGDVLEDSQGTCH